MAVIWMLNHYALPPVPEATGGGRHLNLARFLAKRGHEVVVLTSAIAHMDGRTRVPMPPGEPYVDLHEGSFTCRLLMTRRYRSTAGRLAGMVDFERAALKWSDGLPRPDAVLGSSVHLFAADAAYRLARRFGVPFLFEVRDIWPKTIVDMGASSRANPVYLALRALEVLLYRRADRVVTLLPGTKRHVERSWGDPGKVVYLPNMVSLEPYLDPSYPVLTRREEFRVLYLGNLTPVCALDVLLEAARILQSEHPELPIRVKIVGTGVARQELIDLKARLELRNVEIPGPVPRAAIPAEVGAADACVALLRRVSVVTEYGMSMNKVYEYLGAARPVVFAVEALNDPIAEARAGLSIPPEDARALADALLTLYHTPLEERRAMGRRGHELARSQFSTEVIGERFEAILSEVMDGLAPGTRVHPDRLAD